MTPGRRRRSNWRIPMTLVSLVAFACGARREAEKHDWAKRRKSTGPSAPSLAQTITVDTRPIQVVPVLDGEMTRFRSTYRSSASFTLAAQWPLRTGEDRPNGPNRWCCFPSEKVQIQFLVDNRKKRRNLTEAIEIRSQVSFLPIWTHESLRGAAYRNLDS